MDYFTNYKNFGFSSNPGLQTFYVNGYEGAKMFQTLPNSNVILLDSDNPMMYLKMTNNVGQSTIKCYQIKEVEVPTQTNNNYVLKEDFNKAIGEIKDLIKGLGGKDA